MDAGWETFVSQMIFLVLMYVFLQCLLNVMLIVMFVTGELICMDAGWETSANQWMFPAHKFVITQCHLNVMKIVRYVMEDFTEPVGMEIGANQMMHLALMHAV